jgi:uncharacterized membrane protein
MHPPVSKPENIADIVPRPHPDFWYARGALACVIVMQLLLNQGLQLTATSIPYWALPALEMGLLLLLSFTSTRDRIGHHRAGRVLESVTGTSQAVQVFASCLIGVITLVNLLTLLNLIKALLTPGEADGAQLLDDAAILWISNMVCFALCYWEMDRGGPTRRETPAQSAPDFLFPNMTLPKALDRPWTPRFIDYLFLSFTNASAFSPTDALTLTGRAKCVMMVQAGVSLLTIAIVAARAVNILK